MLKRRWSNAIIRGSAWGLLLNGGGTAISFGAQIILARILEVESFGRYLWVQTWLNAIAVFARVGLDTTAMRYVGGYNAREEYGLLRGFLKWAWRLGTIASTIISALLVAVIYSLNRWVIDGGIHPELCDLFYQLALILPLYTRLQISNSALLSMKHVVRARAPGQVGRPVAMILVIVALYYGLHHDVSASEAMWITNASYAVLLAVNGLFLWQALPAQYTTATPTYERAQWMTTTIPLLFLGAITLLNNSIDVLLFPIVGGTEQELGVYAAVTRVVRIIAFGLQAVNAIFPAVVAELYAKKKMAELQRQAAMSAGLLAAFTIPLSLVLIVGGPWILAAYGEQYASGYPILVILAAGQIVNASCGSVGFILALTGNERLSLRILIGSLALNAGLVAALVPVLGMMGAAIGNTIAISVWNVAMVLAVRKKIGIHPTVLSLIWKPKMRANRPS